MTAKTNTNGASEGTVRIIDSRGVQEQSLEHLDGEITIDLAADGGAKIAAELGSGERREVVVEDAGASTSPSRSSVTDVLLEQGEGGHESFFWLPVAPTLNFLLAVLAAVLVGPTIWSPGASPLGELVVRLGHVWLFGVSLAGTLWMWNDAVAREDRDADWQPGVARYVVAGAATVAAFGGGFFLTRGVPPGEVVVAASGLFILGLPTSAIVSGPVYLYNRSRHGDVERRGSEG